MFLLLWILLLIQPIRRRLPHLHGSVDQRLLSDKVEHLAMHEDHLTTLDARHDIITVLAPFRVRTEEGAQDCGGSGCVGGFQSEFVCDFVDETVSMI